MNHELLKFLHYLRQAKPLDSWQKRKGSAAHLHQQQVHLHLREQARVQHLPKSGAVRLRGGREGSSFTQPDCGPPSKESQLASLQSKAEVVPTPRMLLPPSLPVLSLRGC